MFVDFPLLENIHRGLEIEFSNWRSESRDYELKLQKLKGEVQTLYRERLNLVSSLGFLRLVDDTLGRALDILIKVKDLTISAAPKNYKERKVLQNRINELARNLAELINGFSYDGINPFKGEPYIIQYGEGKNDYIVVNGTADLNRKYGLVLKVSVGKDEKSPSQIVLWNRYYWPGVKRYGIAIWGADGGKNYSLNLSPPPHYIGIPPIVLFPGDPPFYWPPYINSLITLKFTFFVATKNQNLIEISINEVERAIKTFERIRGFYAAVEEKVLNLIEFLYSKESGTSHLGNLLEESKLLDFVRFNLKRRFRVEIENLLILRYFSFYRHLTRLLFGSP